MLRWLTKFWMPLGKRVVIIGGAIQGCALPVPYRLWFIKKAVISIPQLRNNEIKPQSPQGLR
jgi:hypothetical protein